MSGPDAAVGDVITPSHVVSELKLTKDTACDIDEKTPRSSHSVSTDNRESIVRDVDTEFPDGGLRAWLIVAGSVCNAFASFGLMNSWGVYQAYYEETLLSHTPPSQIAWIGSIQYSFIFLPNLISGRWVDLGYYRLPFLLASVIIVAAQMLVAECQAYWQFLLCQGFVIGTAGGFIFGPTLAVMSQWFLKKRSTAYGIMAAGSSVGGTIIPITTRKLIPLVGFKWATRIIAFILLAVLAFSNLVQKTRLPPQNVKGGLFNPRAFKSIPYSVYALAVLIGYFGFYTPLIFFDISATQAGISTHQAFYLTSIANASSLFGRLASGIIADRIGMLNTLIPFTFVAGIMCIVWPFALRSFGTIAIVALIYGFTSGASAGVCLTPVSQMGETGDIGRRTGMLATILTLGAVAGPPVSGAIKTATGSFKAVGAYAGSMMVICCVLMAVARQAATGRLIGGRF